MTLEAALHDHLANDTNISALVSDRVYPLILPAKAKMPALTYQLIDEPNIAPTHDERSSKSLVKPRFQINCYAIDDPAGAFAGYDKAKEVKTAVRQALRGFSGLLGGLQQVSGGDVITQQDDYDPITQRFRVIVDVQFKTLED